MSRRWFIDTAVNAPDFSRIIRDCGFTGAVLVAADEQTEITGAQCISPESISEAHKGFDFVIIGYQKALLQLPESNCLRLDYVYIRFCSTGLKGAALLKEAAISASDNLNYIRTPNTKKECWSYR